MTDHKDLLYYVDRLRAPFRDVVVQKRSYQVDGRVHEITCTSHTDREGLLKQLRDAVIGGIGSHGASTLGAERIPVNVGALGLYERIEREIGDRFVELTDQPVYLELERTLTGWYMEHSRRVMSGRLTLKDDDRALVTVRGWVNAVEDMFNPSTVLELTVPRSETRETRHRVRSYAGDRVETVPAVHVWSEPAPCPECKSRWGNDPRTGDRMFALVVEYRSAGVPPVTELRAVCRFCEHEWVGEDAVKGLMDLIDETDRELVEAGA